MRINSLVNGLFIVMLIIPIEKSHAKFLKGEPGFKILEILSDKEGNLGLGAGYSSPRGDLIINSITIKSPTKNSVILNLKWLIPMIGISKFNVGLGLVTTRKGPNIRLGISSSSELELNVLTGISLKPFRNFQASYEYHLYSGHMIIGSFYWAKLFGH